MRKVETFGLSSKKKLMAEMLANPTEYKTDKSIYKALGVSHQTFYKWLRQDKEITRYAAYLIERYTDKDLGAVWDALIRQCKKGDVRAIKLYFELKGRYTQKVDANITADLNVDNPFKDLTTDELRKLIKNE